MTMPERCDDSRMKEALVALLYDELDAGGRADIEAHLASCAACRQEASALRALRLELPAWTPPERELGFAIVDRTARTERVARSPWALPAWGLAAAAALVLAAGAAIANLEVSYGSDGFRVRTGWSRGEGETAQSVQAPRREPSAVTAAPDPSDEWRVELAGLERRLRDELVAGPVRTVSSTPRADSEDVLRRVQALINESEARQQRELALRLAQVLNDFDRQRQVDLVRIQQGFGQLERSTAVDRELLNQFVRVSQQR
jgi:Putative zinc-finger